MAIPSSYRTFSSRPPRSEYPIAAVGSGRVLIVDDSSSIRTVVATILTRHGYDVDTARDGVEAMKKVDNGAPFDLVLLDFVMPKMNGYQFCRELRTRERHKKLPVVLMSARTHAIGDRFVEQTGAVDALSKPFDARALVAVVGGVLARENHGARSSPDPDEMLDEADLDSIDSLAPPSRHFRTMDRFVGQVALAIMPHLRAMRPHDLMQPKLVEDAIMGGLNTPGVMSGLVHTLDDLDTQQGSNIILRGDIAQMPLAEILQVLQLRRQTGLMKVTSGHKKAVISLREGHVDLIQAEKVGDEFKLGRYLVEQGLFSLEEVEAEHARCDDTNLFGRWLVDRGMLTEDQLRDTLLRQTCELCYELIRWHEGRYTLHDEPVTEEAELVQLGLGMSQLILEGFRRVDEWRHMAGSIDFNAQLVHDKVALANIDEAKFGDDERVILECIDGAATVREVIEASHMASFDAIKIIYQLVQSRLIRQNSA